MIRKATKKDLPFLPPIYEKAKAFMRQTGNPTQWTVTYPEPELLEWDFSRDALFVFEENGTLYGAFVLAPSPDPTYAVIEGAWLNEKPYGVIHRIASNGTHTNLLQEAVDFAFRQYPNVRIDTHEDNKPMQHLLTKLGFTYCGIIYLENGDPRLAYQKEKKGQ